MATRPPGDDTPALGAPAEPPPVRKAQTEAQQAGVLVWGRVAARLSKVVAPLLIVRLLGKVDFGVFATLMLVYETVAVLLTAGFPRSVLYFWANRELPERKGLAALFFASQGVLAIAMAVALGVIGTYGAGALQWLAATLPEGLINPERVAGGETLRLLPVMGVYALFDLPARLLPNIFLAEQRARSSAGASLIQSLGAIVATFVPIGLGYGVEGIVIGHVVFAALYAAWMVRHLARMYPGKAAKPPTTMRQVFEYSLPIGLTDVVSNLNASFDLWLIVLSFSALEVAEYQAGAWQIPIITTIAFSTGAAYMTRFTTLHQQGRAEEALAIWRHTCTKTALIVVPASAIFFVAAEEFVTVAFTADYVAAAPVFRCYCLLTMARVTAFGSLMLAAGRPGLVFRSATLTLLSNVVISIPALMLCGFVGPALGTAIAFVPTVYFYCRYIAEAWGVRVSQTFPLLGYLRIVAVCAVPAAGAWALKASLDLAPALEFAIVGLVVPIGFAAVGTVIGLIERSDWDFVLEWVSMRVLTK